MSQSNKIKLTSLFLLVFLISGLIVKIPAAFANIAGEPCCDEGSRVYQNYCLSNEAEKVIDDVIEQYLLGFAIVGKESSRKMLKTEALNLFGSVSSVDGFFTYFCDSISKQPIAKTGGGFLGPPVVKATCLTISKNPLVRSNLFIKWIVDAAGDRQFRCDKGLACYPDGGRGVCGKEGEESKFYLCNQIKMGTTAKTKCLECFAKEPPGIWTAVGCIPTNPQGMINVFIKLGLSIGGGVALLIILAGAFQLTVSQGEPKQIQDAKDMITSAIIGLIFIIFSVTILQFIGIKIFQLPGFGT